MPFLYLFFVTAYIANALLGLGVFATNYRRTVNQLYLTLVAVMTIWLTFNWLTMTAHSPTHAKKYIQLATAASIFIPACCHLLRISILHPTERLYQILLRAKIILTSSLSVSILCLTPYLIKEVRLPPLDSSKVPEPIYEWAFFVFSGLFIALVCSLVATFPKDRRKLKGLQRTELDYITVGSCMALFTGVLCGLIITMATGSSQTVPIANTSGSLTLSIIVAYGIATKRILGIETILRNSVAYILLIAYLIVVYLITYKVLGFSLGLAGLRIPLAQQVFATICVAISMSPAHGGLQRISAKLIATNAMNSSDVLKKAGKIFQTVSTKQALQEHFSMLLQNALGSEHITILEQENYSLRQSYPDPSDNRMTLNRKHPLCTLMDEMREPVCRDRLERSGNNTHASSIVHSLDEMNSNVAVGIFSKSMLTGIVLFGPRMNGRIYDKNEQDALQILCNQFAVALENAQMYTEMQDNKIRNEIMLDQLVSGVVVANPEGTITLFNHEAQRITAIAEKDAVGKNIRMLPPSMFRALEMALQTQSGVRNVDATLFPQEETCTYVRMGTAYLFGHDGKPMGALMVCTDMTELKSLEEQVRRSDQLSSVGTLAAGMAHEIKNPLVTIKTFTQLLPKRYADEDFRKDFSSLVAQEVERIDGIVNDLLSFSKPAKPVLVPSDLHEIVGQTLKLVHEQMAQKNIALKESLLAKRPVILGDAKLLSQALINLNLNAIQAIDGGDGTITVRTSDCTYRFANGNRPDNATLKKCVRLQISDTGKGIEPKNLKKIFDPFFTSKSEGTGMGLSVAHGIIQEHHGVIEVESEPGRGTTFHIYIPVHDEVGA